MPVFVLIHSPLVGPVTWEPVANELSRRDVSAVVPVLRNRVDLTQPFWEQHVAAVKRSLSVIPLGLPVVLIAHSGAGPLLPAVRKAISQRVAGYIFVDAALPENGKSRLDQFDSVDAGQFRQRAVDGKIPSWTAEDLKSVIPDPKILRQFIDELKPVPLKLYEEPLPVFDGWPDAPCAYLRFGNNPAYDQPAVQVRGAGWIYQQVEGEHFHMLVDPKTVTDALLRITRQLQEKTRGKPA